MGENKGAQIAQINGRVNVILSFKDLLICNKQVCKQIDGRFEPFGVLDFNPTSATVLAGYVVLGVACNTNIRIYEYSVGLNMHRRQRVKHANDICVQTPVINLKAFQNFSD